MPGPLDKIVVQLSTALDEASAKAVLPQLEQILKNEAKRLLSGPLSDIGQLGVRGALEFEQGGRKFRAKGMVKAEKSEGGFLMPFTGEIEDLTKEEERAFIKRQRESIKRFNNDLKRIRKEFEKLAISQENARKELLEAIVPVTDLEKQAGMFKKSDIRKREQEEARRFKRLREEISEIPLQQRFDRIQGVLKSETPEFIERYGQILNNIKRRTSRKIFQEDLRQAIRQEEITKNSFVPIGDLEASAKQMQNTLRRQQQDATRAFRERQMRISNALLGASSLGIGLFGQAGFPLLNIGFSAMSGAAMGMALPVAAAAGAATAIGELSRAINRLSEDSMQTAKQIGAVSTEFKLTEARMTAFKAFVGSGGLTAQRIGTERRLQDLQRMGPNFIDFNTAWNATSQSFWTSLQKRFVTGGIGTRLLGFSGTMGSEFGITLEDALKAKLPDLLSSRRNLILEMSKGMPGIETDPYQVWLRMQNAALDPTKQEEMRIQQELLKAYTDQIKKLEENTRALERRSKESSFFLESVTEHARGMSTLGF